MGRSKVEKSKEGGHTKETMQMVLALCQTMRSTVFSPEQERILINYIEKCVLMFCGLSSKETRQSAYQNVVANYTKYPETWAENGIAGKKWLRSFKKRHSHISLKKPEPCSVARATAFNSMNVDNFFNNLKEVMQRHPTFENSPQLVSDLPTTGDGPQQRDKITSQQPTLEAISPVQISNQVPHLLIIKMSPQPPKTPLNNSAEICSQQTGSSKTLITPHMIRPPLKPSKNSTSIRFWSIMLMPN
ncbi:unnamed protein product [Euphydryas editha]|uniref:HTH CENPB-type domain-containing protein n=1 Tax=Euphydryas editha TaxID=104508 RepID=A0AAU9TYM0_EUPED|nr:unnamed protein product [Euphydryas editha]